MNFSDYVWTIAVVVLLIRADYNGGAAFTDCYFDLDTYCISTVLTPSLFFENKLTDPPFFFYATPSSFNVLRHGLKEVDL
jgi:hypothetical protein